VKSATDSDNPKPSMMMPSDIGSNRLVMTEPVTR
jgi:hypothetical protein